MLLQRGGRRGEKRCSGECVGRVVLVLNVVRDRSDLFTVFIQPCLTCSDNEMGKSSCKAHKNARLPEGLLPVTSSRTGPRRAGMDVPWPRLEQRRRARHPRAWPCDQRQLHRLRWLATPDTFSTSRYL